MKATKNADGILTREWYCFDKDDPVFLKEKVLGTVPITLTAGCFPGDQGTICLLSLIRHQLPCHGTIKRTSLSTGSAQVLRLDFFINDINGCEAKKAGKSMKGIKSFLLGGPLIEDLETCLGQRLPRCTAVGVGWAALACCLLSIRDLVCFMTISPTGPKVNQNPRNYAEQHHEHLDCRTSNPPNLAVFPARLWPMLSTISLLYPSKS